MHIYKGRTRGAALAGKSELRREEKEGKKRKEKKDNKKNRARARTGVRVASSPADRRRVFSRLVNERAETLG